MNTTTFDQAMSRRDTVFNIADTIDDVFNVISNAQAQALDAVIAYNPTTTTDCRRLISACDIVIADLHRTIAGVPCDSGVAGKVKELLRRDADSRLTRVQAQGKNDAYIVIDGKRYPLEVKTNGGRIQALYRVKNPDTRFIVYELDFRTKPGKPRKDGTCKPAEHRQACKVMTVRAFIELIESTKAYKTIGHNDSDREVAVQADSKKLYQALTTGGYIDYDREATYTWSNFNA